MAACKGYCFHAVHSKKYTLHFSFIAFLNPWQYGKMGIFNIEAKQKKGA